MLGSLLDRLKNRGTATAEEADDHLVPMAAATLLLEVAWADHDIADEELAIVTEALSSQFGLDEEEISQVVDASRAAHDESVGLYGFTRTLVEAWDEPARFELVVMLWKLALADDRLDRFEEHTIRKITELLYVSHARFIEAKQTARDL
jgi:uncharacterized tellurite resistance protein B-like protein